MATRLIAVMVAFEPTDPWPVSSISRQRHSGADGARALQYGLGSAANAIPKVG